MTPTSTRQRVELLFFVFFVSGLVGLVYESVWSHYVKLFLGHASYAQTLVLVVFIGGLAVGAALCGRLAERIRNPLRTYALVEAAIGLMALVFHQVFLAATEWGYGTLLPATCDPAGWVCVSQWLLSAGLLLPQSILLGATFPLVSSAVLRMTPEQPGHDIATLYFMNSLGAVLGVLTSAYLLIPSVGLPGALMGAGMANIVIAALAWLLSAAPPPPLATPADAGAGREGDRLVVLLLSVAAITGLTSFVYEIAWIRMLSLVLGASTHSFELMLASFILGLALGGWWVRSRLDSFGDALRVLGIVQVAMGLFAVATIVVYNGSFHLMAWLLSAVAPSESGFVLFNLASVAICLAVMLPATFCAGMTLPLITYRLLHTREGERALGNVYAANTLGSIVGVVVAVHVLLTWVGVDGALWAAAAVDVLLGLALLMLRRPAPGWRAIGAPALAMVGVFLLLTTVGRVDPARGASGVFRTGSVHIGADTRVLFHRDGKTATVDVVGSGSYRAIRTNGKPDAALTMDPNAGARLDEFTMVGLALFPLGHQPEARTAAVIGFGSGMTTSLLLASPNLQRVDTIEIEPAMIEGARAFLPVVEKAYGDRRSRIVVDDAKSYFARSGARYDLIVSEPSNPWVSGVASLFTTEFYRRLDGALNDGGVLAQWVHTYELDAVTLASVLRAVGSVFPEYVVYTPNDGDAVIIARRGGSPGAFDARVLAFPDLQPTLRRVHMQTEASIAGKLVASSGLLRPYFNSFGAPANSDYFPFVDQRASKTRFTKARVGDLSALSASGVPMLEMLDGKPAPRAAPPTSFPVIAAENVSRAASDAYLALSGAAVEGGPSPHADVGRLVRAWSAGCTAGWRFDDVLPSLVSLADAVNTRLAPAQAADAWSRVSAGSCPRALPQAQARWLQLFAATAARDAPAMADLGASLVGVKEAPPEAREYAGLAAVTGLVCTGRFEEAGTLVGDARSWVRNGQKQAELRLLEALLRDADAARAAARRCAARVALSVPAKAATRSP